MTFLALFDSFMRWIFPAPRKPRARRRFPRAPCPTCGKSFALTSRGPWPHDCPNVHQEEAQR